jgi:hypothetical protein
VPDNQLDLFGGAKRGRKMKNIRSGFCRNARSRLSGNVERVKGIEPSSSAWKACDKASEINRSLDFW